MICPNLLYSNMPKPPQPDNPSKEDRYRMAGYALHRTCHTEDFFPILKAMLPPEDITSLAKPGQFKDKRVGIIGGGLAGMSSAFELRKLGFDITVFEASGERIGGRIYTYYFDKEKKLYGELGAMRIPVNHETTWHYINLFNLKTRTFIQTDPNTFIYIHKARARNDPYGTDVMNNIYPTFKLSQWERRTPWQELGYHGVDAPVLNAPPYVRSEIIRNKPTYSKELLFWDSLSTRQMFEWRRLSQSAINLLTNFYPIGGEFLYNNYVDFVQEYYPVNFWFMYEIADGMVNLPGAFYKSFISKTPGEYYPRIPAQLLGDVKWKAGCKVEAIEYRDNQIKLLFQNHSHRDIQTENFDYVICAVPFSILRTMDIRPQFSNSKMQAIKEVNYGNAQKSIFNCNRRFWEEQGIFGGGSYTDLPITTSWYPSHPPGQQEANIRSSTAGVNPGVLIASYGFNLDAVRIGSMPEDARFEKLKQNVEELHGLPKGMLDSIVTDFKSQVWHSDPLFRGAYCYYTPQQKKLFSWVMKTPEWNKRIFFAGEHVSGLHRWIQGALQSGMEASNALAASVTG